MPHDMGTPGAVAWVTRRIQDVYRAEQDRDRAVEVREELLAVQEITEEVYGEEI